jgi:hypothetical protein
MYSSKILATIISNNNLWIPNSIPATKLLQKSIIYVTETDFI